MSVARVIDVVEAAYALDGTEQAWLTNLAESTAPALDRGLGIIGYIGDTATMRTVTFAAVGLSDAIMQMLGQLARSGGAGISEGLFSDGLRPYWEASGFVDGLGVYAHVADGKSVHLFAGSPSRERPDRRMRRLWERVAAHIAAGHRVRGGLAKLAAPEAILDVSGRMHDACADAAAVARETLRTAVKLRERARTKRTREDGERALEMWQGLVAGRWSLVDRWESDGKRFIAAVENQPENLDPRALRPREGAAARLAAEGAAPKDIAYALGISPSNARALLAQALAKLGLASRAELLRWSPHRGHVLVDGDVAPDLSTLVLTESGPPRWDVLTGAEREVAELAADGKSNAEIAKLRETSVRTVANQMAAILEKLSVHSRADLLRASLDRAQ